MALEYLRKGGKSDLFNYGYGQGSSVLEVIDTAKKVTGKDFKVDIAPRRASDIVEVVAGAKKIRQTLGWQPRFDDLEKIVQHAWSWEKKLN